MIGTLRLMSGAILVILWRSEQDSCIMEPKAPLTRIEEFPASPG